MKKFRKILATTDLSPESWSAVSYAGHLARANDAKLSVLHVAHTTALYLTDFSPPVDLLKIDDEIEEAAKRTVSGWVRRHLRQAENIDVIVKQGVTHEVVCSVAEQTKASVIVMATHGRRGVAHALLGSVTERVLRDAPCPVLVIKPPAPTVTTSRKSTSASTDKKKGPTRKSKAKKG